MATVAQLTAAAEFSVRRATFPCPQCGTHDVLTYDNEHPTAFEWRTRVACAGCGRTIKPLHRL